MKRFRLLALLVPVSVVLAQTPSFETFEVRLHNLDIVVTDAKGNPVHGLTKDDFVVLEDGVPQTITNFSTYDQPGVRWPQPPPSHDPSAQEDTKAVAAAPALQARRVIFFVDDMEVQSPTRRKLVRYASAFVDEMREGDLAAVIRPTGLHRIAQSYTTDTAAVRTALTEAIESCKVRGDSPGAGEIRRMRNAMENAIDDLDRKMAKGEYASASRKRSLQRLAQIRALVGSMAGVEGRKVLVLITYGISAVPGRDAFTQDDLLAMMGPERSNTDWSRMVDLNPAIDELARTAAANGVTIYAVEPEQPYGLFELRTSASKPKGYTSGPGGGHAGVEQGLGVQNMYELMHFQAQTMTSLTEKTGGKWFRGVATLDDLFRQVASDLRVYYSLAYRATGQRDKPLKIEVHIRNHPELRARTRTDVIDKSPESEMADLVMASVLFPRDINELHLNVTTAAPTRQGKNYTIPLDITLPLDALTFVRGANDLYTATLDVHFAAAGQESDFTTSGVHQQTIELTADLYLTRAGRTYRYKSGIQIPAGPTKIAIGVMDRASRLAGFQTVDVVGE
jgi:VWFA-related protein